MKKGVILLIALGIVFNTSSTIKAITKDKPLETSAPAIEYRIMQDPGGATGH